MTAIQCRLPSSSSPHPAPTLVLYHANCPDGFTAAWVYWRALGDKARYVPVAYGSAPPDVDGEDVVVVDFSYSREECVDLASRARSFRVLDHHVSAQTALKGLDCFHFDITRSGSGLAWQDLHGDAPPPFLIECVEDRDLYVWRHEGSADILHVLDTVPHDFEQWEALARRLDEDPQSVREEGAIMRARFEVAAQRLLPHARSVEVAGARGLVVNAPMEFADYVGNVLADQADFGFTWYLDAQGRVHASWRSKGFDVIPLAEAFGGGGHRRAAGARLTVRQLAEMLGVC